MKEKTIIQNYKNYVILIMWLVFVAVGTDCPIVVHYSPNYGPAEPKQNAI